MLTQDSGLNAVGSSFDEWVSWRHLRVDRRDSASRLALSLCPDTPKKRCYIHDRDIAPLAQLTHKPFFVARSW